MGHVTLFSDFLRPVLPETLLREGTADSELMMQIVAAIVSLGGVYIAYYVYVRNPEIATRLRESLSVLHHLWHKGWGFDSPKNVTKTILNV